MGGVSSCKVSAQCLAGVLIVEDEPLVALFLKDVIEDAGWRVEAIADSGDKALDLAEKHRISLAFLDLRLRGDSDGVATAERLATRHRIQIVFMSGRSDLETDERIAALRPLAILTKPCSPQVIHQALERAQQGQ
jgi:CheY-like chemotaxis protein